ncbi:MAG TPA: hypothetical protein VES38_06665 [Methylotenera sp.]|nr:hypothetical protein [Methylotenera sp.]
MNYKNIALAVIILFISAWWFRYDVYCNHPSSCIAYDRFSGNWIQPSNVAYDHAKEVEINALIKETKSKMNVEKVKLLGYTNNEITEEIRKEYRLAVEKNPKLINKN